MPQGSPLLLSRASLVNGGSQQLNTPPPRPWGHCARAVQVCWDTCVQSPGSYLSSKESTCLENCARRFVETTQYILQVREKVVRLWGKQVAGARPAHPNVVMS